MKLPEATGEKSVGWVGANISCNDSGPGAARAAIPRNLRAALSKPEITNEEGLRGPGLASGASGLGAVGAGTLGAAAELAAAAGMAAVGPNPDKAVWTDPAR